MLIVQILIIFIIGFVFGYFTFSIISSKNKSSKDLKEELRVVKHEMEQYKQDVADHFSCTTKLINQISKDCNKLNSHMTNSSNYLIDSNFHLLESLNKDN